MEEKYQVLLVIASMTVCTVLIIMGEDGVIAGALATLLGYVSRLMGEKVGQSP